MPTYLRDTDICIFFLKNKFEIKQKIERVGIENCYLSEITIAELNYGAFKSRNLTKHLGEIALLQELFDTVPIRPYLEAFGQEKARVEALGKRLPDFDLLIGIAAIQQGMVLVTNNEKHFMRMEGIKIENWTKNL